NSLRKSVVFCPTGLETSEFTERKIIYTNDLMSIFFSRIRSTTPLANSKSNEGSTRYACIGTTAMLAASSIVVAAAAATSCYTFHTIIRMVIKAIAMVFFGKTALKL
ncbi:hypothetical protein OTU49_002662, partial [Cherax quadricarinatus]